MDSALKVMDLYASQKALLEVEYFGEVGTGLGPTLEFYTLVSRELRRAELRLWLDDGPPTASDKIKVTSDDSAYVFSAAGLYPRPIAQTADGVGVPARTLQLFTFMGKFIAKAMLDNRLVDLPLSATLYRQLLGFEMTISDLEEVHPQLGLTLRKLLRLAHKRTAILRAGAKPADASSALAALTLDGADVGDLGLDFTLPGQPEVELVPDGANKDVTLENVGEYAQRVLDVFLCEGVRAQVAAFRKGFSTVFPVEKLAAFSTDELDVLLNGSRERWEVSTIVEHLKFDHGYTRSSRAVGFLLEVICDFDDATLSTFLKFVTGSPRLPVGGLARLSPRLTIVRKSPEEGVSPDAYLPSVMTCANYVKLPDYSSKEIMRERLVTAINEGQGAFYLS
jgi:E3 ubiquitin-protein ligase TRIP12